MRWKMLSTEKYIVAYMHIPDKNDNNKLFIKSENIPL